MRAAIYCRVSTQDQEREGTSLKSQLEACKKLAHEKGYETRDEHIIQEIYSGLTLDRPDLTKLRGWLRNGEVNAVVVYSSDRFSRDGYDFLTLVRDCRKANVDLLCVTEPLQDGQVGELISYVRGWASKLEAEKIKERTTRGRRVRVETYGKLPTGRGVLYGYNYDKERGLNIANNCLDIVRMVGMWVLEEGISLNEACRRLMKMGIVAPKGGTKWSRSAVGRILRNPTYAGKTYAFKTKTVGNRRVCCPREDQVEIPNAVDRVAFTWEEWLGIQRQLDKNKELSPRNQKLSYLLRGMVFCKWDGHKYYGVPMRGKPYYRCRNHSKLLSPEPCHNRNVNGEWLDNSVWHEVEKVLKNPKIILAELQRRKESGSEVEHLEKHMQLNRGRLDTLNEAETRYLRLYGLGFLPLDRLENECKKIKVDRQRIEQENVELEKRIRDAREITLSISNIKRVCKLAAKNLANFTDEQKRLALQALDIKVWVDGDSITIEGVLPMPEMDTVSQPV